MLGGIKSKTEAKNKTKQKQKSWDVFVSVPARCCGVYLITVHNRHSDSVAPSRGMGHLISSWP